MTSYPYMNLTKTIAIVALLACCNLANAQFNGKASEDLIKRILPKHANQFVVEQIKGTNNKDTFQIESKNGKIVLSGNNGVSIASALYFYLNEFCHCQITWNGVNLHLPDQLPTVTSPVRKSSPYEYRYNLNYCTFNYSMSWWNFERWEQEIDWMALHGINMPLAITGEEYVWREVYQEMGFTDDDLKDFFCGPSYFSWFWMGNLDGWGGPLPKHWMVSHKELQQKIVQRERELGMKPVLPAFTGHVPAAFKKKFPNAKLKQTNWGNDFSDTYILDSEDPLFAQIGRKFLEKQTQVYGTDHLYSADTFNENEPPSDEPAFLSKLSARVYEGMKQADPKAVWVMQGWLFFSDRKFWKAPQIKALLDAVPNEQMIILDLAAEIEPIWKRTESFYGKPWVWNMLNNFGGNTNLFGRMQGVADGPALALNDAKRGNLKGIGLTMEAIEQNPVIYELMMHHTWGSNPIDLDKWLPEYVRNRYGLNNQNALNAWQVLRNTVYNGKLIRDGAESIIQARPTLDSMTRWTMTRLNYPAQDLLPAWDELIKASSASGKSDGFQFDLVDVSRQVLANYALPLQRKLVAAYQKKEIKEFNLLSKQFIELIEDMDQLLATRKDFLLGRWIADARQCGLSSEEKAIYEMNAKDLITLWGGANNRLHEYACRQWSGLLNDFYKPRWQQFFAQMNTALKEGKEVDVKAFQKEIADWEWKWVNERKDYPTATSGDPIKTAKKMYDKYRNKL